MSTLETVVLALRMHACEPRRTGRDAWRAPCPCCGEADALGVGWGWLGGLSLAPRCGCHRDDVLEEL